MNVTTGIIAGVSAIGIIAMGMSSSYIINEGRVGVITTMGKAERQEGPEGLKFKTPFITGVREFDVRERALSGELSAATSNQLVTNLSFSVNWRPDAGHIMDIFINYGSPDQFAAETVRPRLQQSLKATVGEFTAVDMTRKREEVAAAMLANAQETLAQYPIIISSVQIENFTLPERYMEAVLQKEEQREATAREQLNLEQQRIQAQREVQTAQAQSEAARARADGEAYALTVAAEAEAKAIRLTAEAEADGIRAIQEAISENPLLIEYERVKAWDGTLPTMVMGDQPNMMLTLQ